MHHMKGHGAHVSWVAMRSRAKQRDRRDLGADSVLPSASQGVTCAPITATASAPCTGPSTPCGAWWAPAVLRQRLLHPRSPSGCGTCRGRCAFAPARCPAWPTASVQRRGSSRAPGLGPSRESCSCRRRSKQEPSGTLSISGK